MLAYSQLEKEEWVSSDYFLSLNESLTHCASSISVLSSGDPFRFTSVLQTCPAPVTHSHNSAFLE